MYYSLLFTCFLLLLFVITSHSEKLIVCEQGKLEISCEGNNVIQINKANYGRTSRRECITGDDEPNDISCHADETFSIMHIKCADKQGCSIDAKNEVFGDPCYGTVKYLEVDYECVPDPDFQYKTVCEHEALTISCKGNGKIRIAEANFGRNTRNICNIDPIKTTYCINKRSTGIIANMCDYKEECTVQADVQVLGDPCHGTKKYLTIKYKCVQT